MWLNGGTFVRKAIFWDSDGTILYGNESFKISFLRACADNGYNVDEQIVKQFMVKSCSWYSPEKDHSDLSGEEWWNDLLNKMHIFCKEIGISDCDVEIICNSFRRKVIDYEYEAYPDANEILTYFHNMGYENYIISNNFPELGQVLERLGLAKYISGVFTSAAMGYEKPRKEAYQYAIGQAGYPELCIMIGDNPVADYQGGMKAGMKAILVHSTPLNDEVCCVDLMDLKRLIKE